MSISYFIKRQNLLLSHLSIDFIRDRYMEYLEEGEKLIGLIGARGVGKTTLLLQYIKRSAKKALYFSADDIVFQNLELYSIAEEAYILGYRVVVIDEVHKYEGWARELKNIYDGFPDITLRISGSSMLNILYEKYDLSRRLLLHRVIHLSFREYMSIKSGKRFETFALKDILTDAEGLSSTLVFENPELFSHFRSYLEFGAYPFFIEGEKHFSKKLFGALDKVIHEDIPSLNKIDFSHLMIFKKLIFKVIDAGKPYQVNVAKLARDLHVSEATLYTYFDILDQSAVLTSIRKFSKKSAKKPEKLLFSNSSILYAYAHDFDKELDIGTVREVFFVSCFASIYYSDIGDFRVDDSIFEIGGKSKGFKQIQDVENSFVVSDIDYTVDNRKIPLWLFGFLH